MANSNPLERAEFHYLIKKAGDIMKETGYQIDGRPVYRFWKILALVVLIGLPLVDWELFVISSIVFLGGFLAHEFLLVLIEKPALFAVPEKTGFANLRLRKWLFFGEKVKLTGRRVLGWKIPTVPKVLKWKVVLRLPYISRGWGAILVFLFPVLSISIVLLFGKPVLGLVKDAYTNFQAALPMIGGIVDQVLVNVGEFTGKTIEDNVFSHAEKHREAITLTQAFTQFKGLLMTAVEVPVVWAVLVYIAYMWPKFGKKVRYFMHDNTHGREDALIDRFFAKLGTLLKKYVQGQMFMIMIMSPTLALILGLVLWSFDGVVIGLAFGLLAFIPMAVTLSKVVALLLLAAQFGFNFFAFGFLWRAIALIVIGGAVTAIEGKILLPKIQGKQLNIHEAVGLMGLLLGARWFGFFGIVMAYPVMVIMLAAYLTYHKLVLPFIKAGEIEDKAVAENALAQIEQVIAEMPADAEAIAEIRKINRDYWVAKDQPEEADRIEAELDGGEGVTAPATTTS